MERAFLCMERLRFEGYGGGANFSKFSDYRGAIMAPLATP